MTKLWNPLASPSQWLVDEGSRTLKQACSWESGSPLLGNCGGRTHQWPCQTFCRNELESDVFSIGFLFFPFSVTQGHTCIVVWPYGSLHIFFYSYFPQYIFCPSNLILISISLMTWANTLTKKWKLFILLNLAYWAQVALIFYMKRMKHL